MGWEYFSVVRFDLGPLLQGQTTIAKFKSADNWLIFGPRGLQYETWLWRVVFSVDRYLHRFSDA